LSESFVRLISATSRIKHSTRRASWRLTSAQLCVLHVAPPVETACDLDPYLGSIPWHSADYQEAVTEGARQKLGEVIEHKHFGIEVLPLLREGNAADEIVSAVGMEHCDLIIIATHGLSGWRHLDHHRHARAERLATSGFRFGRRKGDSSGALSGFGATRRQTGGELRPPFLWNTTRVSFPSLRTPCSIPRPTP
jgi:nucleotide-binding universal stress UspA family protein